MLITSAGDKDEERNDDDLDDFELDSSGGDPGTATARLGGIMDAWLVEMVMDGGLVWERDRR